MNDYRIITAADDLELILEAEERLMDVWPEFMLNDAVANRLWHRLYDIFPAFQFGMVGVDGEVVALGNSLLLRFEHDLSELPDRGWDWAMEKGFSDFESEVSPNLHCGVSITVARKWQGRGLGTMAVSALREIGLSKGLSTLIIPVRPSHKHLRPELSIDEYVALNREDGLPQDPWLRIHSRLGAGMIGICRQAMTITGSLSDWKRWTGRTFTRSGSYNVDGALAQVEIDLAADRGVYVEPNVWMHHELK